MDENSENILKDGIRVATLSSWNQFHDQISSLTSKRGYVWRGQRKDEEGGWPLQSSFDRKAHSRDRNDRAKKLQLHLDNFKKAMNKSYPGVLPQNDLDVWALGQHYGLWTPVLDWTDCPYIATYFAFIDAVDPDDQNDRYRYVYALNRAIERLMSKEKKAGQTISAGRSVPFLNQLTHPNPRFRAQKGVFTEAFYGEDILKYVKIFSKKRPSQPVTVKFRIPTKDRQICLDELNSGGINHMSVLLDLRAVVEACNEDLRNRA